ncbi:MAG: 6-O-methylguanine DNA methyltransferase [Deltaproteobacteria bacterium GWB2_65_81]|nr:MAG: 6-O-methylguanine DNA methyltransferase [Deltaproteobacteria bacterium GWB2_65_81]OGP40573.1 MAG: 6-O-methylguanine DNA methyltransferase [Deltaproteobacteria bacterium GWC2_66_88]HAM32066.1 6-O-methylguanine DNA methyltransferase [Deltaproteobacteria bacterium]
MHPSDYTRIEKAIHYIEGNFRGQPGLKEVARNAGLSEYHFHRLFTRWAGISPKRFLQFLTAEYARGLLRESRNVLDAAYGAGLSGPGRLHDLIVNVYAVTPGELKEEGAGLTIRYGVHPSPFGDCLLAITDKGICALAFLAGRRAGEAVEELRTRWGNANLVLDPGPAKAVAGRIFVPSRWGGAPPLNVIVKGTNFQVKVWEALVRIPPGRAASYEEIAARIDAPGAVRAVGNALARNPVAFLIPCHRVIRKTGAFGEYRWGAARKKAILAWEAAASGRG